MNQKEFLAALAKTKETRKWCVTELGAIRTVKGTGCVCPIVAVAGLFSAAELDRTLKIGKGIGLNLELIYRIVDAADMAPYHHVLDARAVRLRRRMLRALGLTKRRKI